MPERRGFTRKKGETMSATRAETCPTCGSPVEVVSSDEGTQHYRLTRAEGLSEGDRTRLEELRECCAEQGEWPKPGPCEIAAGKDADALTHVLAAFDQQAAALEEARVSLEAADELATRVEGTFCGADTCPRCEHLSTRVYRSSRTEGDAG